MVENLNYLPVENNKRRPTMYVCSHFLDSTPGEERVRNQYEAKVSSGETQALVRQSPARGEREGFHGVQVGVRVTPRSSHCSQDVSHLYKSVTES